MEITSLQKIKEMANGIVVILPPFDDGTPFPARLRRPSILGMVCEGKIPNELISYAAEMINVKNQEFKADEKFSPERLQKTYAYMEVVARECLVEPTYDDILETGYKLNDDQLAAILIFSQVGHKAIKNFRSE